MTQELKNTHTEQMTRLHFKHQTECDLLEDMRYDGSPLCVNRSNTILCQSMKKEKLKQNGRCLEILSSDLHGKDVLTQKHKERRKRRQLRN